MKHCYALVVTLLVSLLVGCASAPAGGEATTRRQTNVLTLEEIQQHAQASDVYEVIRALRPNWLRTRGQQSLSDPTAGQVVIYLDGTRAGGPEFLRQVAVQNVQGAQYLGAGEATSRFGTGHTGGAILIVTRRS